TFVPSCWATMPPAGASKLTPGAHVKGAGTSRDSRRSSISATRCERRPRTGLPFAARRNRVSLPRSVSNMCAPAGQTQFGERLLSVAAVHYTTGGGRRAESDCESGCWWAVPLLRGRPEERSGFTGAMRARALLDECRTYFNGDEWMLQMCPVGRESTRLYRH